MQGNGITETVRSKLAQMGECTVLELGCGHGLPGITAALLGSKVHFQVNTRLNNLAPMLAVRVLWLRTRLRGLYG